MFSKFLYHAFLVLYPVSIRIASLWNPKAKKWVGGRKNIFPAINSKLQTLENKPVWMHCASLGEFEQGRPLLEELKNNDPQLKIVLTFFSSSGYEVMKDYPGVDFVFYLPLDSRANAKKFLDAVQPSLALWVKYEYWFYYLDELKRRNIPTILISGVFRKQMTFFRWYGGIWKKMLASFNHFFVQNDESKQLLATIGFTKNVSISGDTRFDRVLEIADRFEEVPLISEYCGNSTVIVAGSTWEEDEIELLHFVKANPRIKFIIAPHEIDAENLKDVKKEFPNSIFYSNWLNSHDSKANVLIIDNIGMLSRLYKYATITYVGGGFGVGGIHNVLEAAVYGKPVLFGPEYERYYEAVGLVNEEGGISVDGPISLEEEMNKLLNDETERKRRGEAAKKYVHSNAGASKKIIQFIQEKRLLTNP